MSDKRNALALRICGNCLDTQADRIVIEDGNDRTVVQLCDRCSEALSAGEFEVLRERYSDQTTITRDHFRPAEVSP